jgi:putative transposase
MVTGVTPDRVTTDGHDSYPRAIRTVLGTRVRHRDSQYLNNRLEQDHRGVNGRYGPMRGFKCPEPVSKSPPTTAGSTSFAAPQRF